MNRRSFMGKMAATAAAASTAGCLDYLVQDEESDHDVVESYETPSCEDGDWPEELSDEEIPDQFQEIIDNNREYQEEIFEHFNEESTERELIDGEPLEEPLYKVESIENGVYPSGSFSDDPDGGFDLGAQVKLNSESEYSDISAHKDDYSAVALYSEGLETLTTGVLANVVKKHRPEENPELHKEFEESTSGLKCRVVNEEGESIQAHVSPEKVDYFRSEFEETELSEDREQSEVWNEIFDYVDENKCYDPDISS